jgi:T5orf172 domain-containing protein
MSRLDRRWIGLIMPPMSIEELLDVDSNSMSDEELRAHIERLRKLRKKGLGQVLKDESHGRPEHQGFIYIASNPAMPGLLKIGSTAGPAEKRVLALSRPTGVPEPFKVERWFPVYQNPKKLEKKIHGALALFRLTKTREFFRLSVEYAAAAIEAILGEIDPVSGQK